MYGKLIKDIANYNAAYLDLLSNKYGGDATVNEIRVMNYVLRANLAGRDVGVSCAAKALDIPKSTVSRAAQKFRTSGWLDEVTSEADGRRRHLKLTARIIDRFDAELDMLRDHWPHAA